MSSEAIMGIGALLMASGVTAFSICIALLVPLNQWPVVLTIPLLEGQWVMINEAGSYSLRGDTGGTFTFVFVGLRFTLQAANGAEISGYRPPARSRGPNGVPLWRFHVPAPGSYYLRVSGLSDRDLTPFKLMFLRVMPFKGWPYAGGIAAGVVCFLAGLVMMFQ